MPDNLDFYIKLALGLLLIAIVVLGHQVGLISESNLAILIPAILNFILGLSATLRKNNKPKEENKIDIQF